VQIGNPTHDAVVLGAAVALGAAVVLGAARVVVTAGSGVVELAVAACGRDGEDDEHAARPKTAAKIIKEFKSPDDLIRIQRILEKMRLATPTADVASPP